MVFICYFFSLKDGKYREALGKWENALTLMPGKAVLHEQKAQVLLEIGDAWNALKAATREPILSFPFCFILILPILFYFNFFLLYMKKCFIILPSYSWLFVC